MEKFNDKQTYVSEFNEASLQIQRLHNLWLKCNAFSQAGRLEEWKWVLDRVWIELSADAEDKHKTENKLLNKIISLSKNPTRLYNALQRKEIFLRGLQESAGKGSKKKKQYEQIL